MGSCITGNGDRHFPLLAFDNSHNPGPDYTFPINKVETLIDIIHHQRKFKITFVDDNIGHLKMLEDEGKRRGLILRCLSLTKSHSKIDAVIEVSGRKKHLSDFNRYLIECRAIEDVLT